ncbi:hypothetical protein CRG98_024235 [Punica granatum]|uniref:Uncharacterized protein n=1 Tax=Punica granatum TaxID=22663 RepID=A0A2I0JGK3_PUNGR|nr:hypothetical protein CRG98_024235 [Punica granatum]
MRGWRRQSMTMILLPRSSALTEDPSDHENEGRQSTIPTPPPRLLTPIEDFGDLGGGIGVADWLPLPLWPSRSHLSSQSIRGIGPPIGYFNATTDVTGTHRGRWRPQWYGRDRRLATLVP